jgi:hypothetical protein
MANSEWRKADVPPGPDDCGPNSRIIVWHRYNGAMVANTSQLAENQFMEWWMPYPDYPEGAARLKDELSKPAKRM